MRAIPLNLLTLYADLMQSVEDHVRPGSLATKTVSGRKYVYLTVKDGSTRIERYVGAADDTAVVELSKRVRRAAERASARRNTVSLLKRARIPAPTLTQGRILQVLANAGLFKRGMTLVGTVAFQSYPCIVGYHLGATAYATNDIDLSVAEFIAADKEEDIGSTLKRADPTFEPRWHSEDRLPRTFVSRNFQVDIVTRYGPGRRSPVLMESLGCAAAALTFQEYAAEETMEVVALYDTGVLVRVPTPLRYAVHKLLVAHQRPPRETAKKQKDLRQARELIDVFLETDDSALRQALDDARGRGRSWKMAIDRSLRDLGLDAGPMRRSRPGRRQP
ncbi:MAG: GSU2403 family nucleotidyltransferase fold protein [Hyphomicrobium sp.]